MAHRWMFLKQFVRRPKTTGAIAPSSRALARRMIAEAGAGEKAVIVEYGPGTGSFTVPILESLKPGQRFFTIEINPDFRALLLRKYPDLSIHEGCCSTVAECCKKEGVAGVDCVMSGLPWAIFPDELQTRILAATREALVPGGRFVTFAYTHALVLPAAKRFRRKLHDYFEKVHVTKTVWGNLPPACCFVGTKG